MGKIFIQDKRISFFRGFEAEAFPGGNGQKYFSVKLLIPYGDPMVKVIEDELMRELLAKYEKQDKAQQYFDAFPRNDFQKACWADGKYFDWDGAEGHMILNAVRKEEDGRPGLYDRNKSPLQASDGRPYSGCFCNGSVKLWIQDNKFGKGLPRCEFVSLQYNREGDSFGGASRASADDYQDLSAGADAEDEFA